MKRYTAAIVGGGASGIMCALRLQERKVGGVVLFEKNDRLGRKLSATGNGQGNVTNTDISEKHYFSSDRAKAAGVLRRFDGEALLHYLTSLGGLFSADARGRVYPVSRQASSVTDILRFALRRGDTEVHLGEEVREAVFDGEKFLIRTEKGSYAADRLVLCCGGKAARHFGTDGSGYALARVFGHSVTALQPSLVQLQTDREFLRGLKGVKADCGVSLLRKGATAVSLRGDVIFTDYGISGDAVFRLSAFYREGDSVSVDFLPDFAKKHIGSILREKASADPALPAEDLFRCIVNSAVGRAILRRCGIAADSRAVSVPFEKFAQTAKEFVLKIEGTAGFDSAQVTKGGIPLDELDADLMSKKQRGLYIIGELADVDGECGGYNLQWAFSSGEAAAAAISRSVKVSG